MFENIDEGYDEMKENGDKIPVSAEEDQACAAVLGPDEVSMIPGQSISSSFRFITDKTLNEIFLSWISVKKNTSNVETHIIMGKL